MSKDTQTPNRIRWIRKALIAASVAAFVLFTIWIIHEANIGRDNALFKLVRATPYGDKIGHFFLAGFLTLAANFVCGQRSLRLLKLHLPLGSLLVVILAIIEESSQYFLPTRSLDIQDTLANFVGILIFSIPHYLQRGPKSGDRRRDPATPPPSPR